MITHRAFEFRIYPSRDQQDLIARTFGCVRLVYNHYLTEKKQRNAKSKKALKINGKTGKIKVTRKTKKGTYKMRVTVTAAGSDKYEEVKKTVTVIVKVTK